MLYVCVCVCVTTCRDRWRLRLPRGEVERERRSDAVLAACRRDDNGSPQVLLDVQMPLQISIENTF